ncbi:MAG: EAL domain-containing protein [Lachnospiraceae bacterium]|nr:EAL domain-containing protein [Lachnospiraceae bacterium]
MVIFAFILLLIYTRKDNSKASNWLFFIFVSLGMLSAVSDIISSYYISYPERTTHFMLDFWNYFFLSVHNLMSYVCVIYVIFLIGLEQRMRPYSWVLVSLPGAASLLLIFGNPFTQQLFYYREGHLYTHGPLFFHLYALSFFNLALSIFLVLRFKKALPLPKVLSLVICVLFCVIPITIQMFRPYLLIELFFESIGLMSILFAIENEDEIRDTITGAYNRFAFIRDMELAIHTRTPLTFVTVKLFNFTYSNTTFGVQYMNHVLRDMTVWLKSQGRRTSCYVFSGGRFAIVQRGADKEQMAGLAERIRERFDLEWAYASLSVVFPAQICLVAMPDEVSTMDQLMLTIETPVGETQSHSEIVTSDTLHSYQREVLIQQKMKEALENHAFEVYYQPIWDKGSGRILCAEALVRLFDEELGAIPPDEFIPIAERNGMIMDIGSFVIEEACRFYADNHLERFGIDYLEVNLSVVQCMNHHLPGLIREILAKKGLKPQQLNLEITESAAAGNKAALEKTVRELAGYGFTLSLDDYGTGYSNYSYMFALPFKIIKIDKSILWSALDCDNQRGEFSSMILLENTVRMLRQMQYRVVAEGVETVQQKALLESLGCDYMQGYLFSKPLPSGAFLEFVRTFGK